MGSPQASSTESPKELSFEEVLGGPETKEPEKGFVENVVDTVKGAGQELIDDPAQAALAGGSAAAESYGSLKAGELVSHALGRDKGFNQAIARGVGMIPRVGKILRPIVAPALGMAEFAGASALAHEGIKAGEGAVGVGEAIEKAQAANPNISTTAGTAVMGGMAAKSLKGYKNMLANEGLGKTAVQAGGAAVGGAAFPYIDYGTRKGINAVAGEGTVGEIPVPTSEDVMHSARDMAILGGMGYKGGAPKKSEVKEPLGTEPVKTEEMPPEDTPLSEEEDAAVQSAMEGKKVAITALDEASKNAETSDSPAVAEALKEEAAKVADSPVSSTATPPSVEVGVEAESVAEITPAAQSFADKNGIDISQVAPGKNGRVTVNDVRKHRAANQPKSKTNETQISQTEPLAESTPGQAIEQLPTEAAGVLPGVPEGQAKQVADPLSSADAPNPQGVSAASETPVAEQPAASKPKLPPEVEQADLSTPEGRATMHIAAAIQKPENFAFHQAGILRELQEAQAAKAEEQEAPKTSKKKAKIVDPTAPVYDATNTYREFSDGRAESFNLETNEWEPTKKRELPAPETPEVPTPEQLAGEIPEPDNIPEEAMEPEAPKPQGEVTKEARRLAEAEGVDLSQITPNKQGNITKREITTYLKSVPKEQPPVAKQPVPEAPAVEPEVAEVPVAEAPKAAKLSTNVLLESTAKTLEERAEAIADWYARLVVNNENGHTSNGGVTNADGTLISLKEFFDPNKGYSPDTPIRVTPQVLNLASKKIADRLPILRRVALKRGESKAAAPKPEVPVAEPEVPVVEEPIIEPDNGVPTTNVRVHTSQGNLGLSMADAQRQEQDFFGRVHSKQGVLPPRIKASEGQGTGVTRYTSVGGKTGGGGIDYNDLKTLETLKSLKTGKKALIFKQQAGGESAVYKIDLDSADEASLREQLKNSGLENTAIETDPATGKTSVLIFSNDASPETLKAVKQLAYENGTKRPITKYEGTGELIGEDPVALADYLRESLGRLSSGGGDGESGGPDRLRMANSLWDLASEAGVKLGERPTAYEDPREKASSESEYVVSLEDQLAADAKIPEELDTKYKQLLLKAFDFVDRALGLSAIELEELREKGDYTPNKDEYYLNLLKRVEAGSLVPYVGEDGRVRFRESNKGFGDFSGYYKSKDVLKSIVVGKLRVKLAEALDGTKDKNQTNNGEKAKALLEQVESLDEEIEKIKENPELSPEQTKELQDLDAKRVKLTKQINPWDLSTKNFQAYVKGFLQNAVKSTQRALKKRANKGLGETNVGDLEETGTSKTEGGVTPAEEILDNTGRGQENDSALDDNVRGDVGGTGDKLDPKADASVQVTAAIRFAQDRKMPVEDRLAVLRKLGEWARVGTQGASSEHSLEVLNIGGELGKSSSPLQKQIGFDISRDFSLADILRGKHRDNAGNLLPGDQSKDLTRYKFSENYELLPEENTSRVTEAIAKDFGGNVPSRISVVYDPDGGWTARIGGGKLEVNSAIVKPENVSLEIDHEVGHVLWRVPEYHAKFDELWNSLSPESQAEINKVVEDLYSNESEDIRFEEKRVRALEQIRTEALKTEQGASAWNKLVEYIKNFWKELTGATDIDENRAQKLAAEMVEIGRAVAFDLDGDLRYRKVEKNERFTEKVSEAGPNRNLSEEEKVWFNSQQVKQAEAAAQNWIDGGGSFENLMDRNVPLSIPEVIHAAAIFRSRATGTKAGIEAKEKRGEALTAVEIRSKNEALKQEKLSNQLLSRIMSEGGQALGHAQDLNRKFGAFNPEHYIKMLIGGTPEELIEGKMNIRKLKQGLEEIKAEAAQITVAATEPYLEQAGITGEKDLTLLRDILADPSTSYRNVKDAIASLMPNANPAKVTALAERIFRTYSAVGTRIGKQRLPQMVVDAYNGEAITPPGDQFLKKLGDFLKIGKYEEDQLNNALLESLGLTGYDTEFIKGIRKDIDAMNAMPEGDLRNGAGTEILNKVKKKFYNAVLKDFRNKANRKHIWDMITAAWQAGVLSGPPTASVNLLGSSFSITVESTMEAVGYAIKTGDMKYFADVYSGFLSAVTGGGKGGMPSSAWAEAVSAMRGKGTRYRNSLMQEASALENIDATDLEGAVKYVAKHGNNLKWVGRVMTALDVINMTAADEAKQRMAMRFFLSESKGHDQAEVSRVMEQLFEPSETLSGEFRKQAEADIAKYLPNAVGKERKNWIDRRTLELARQEREKILPDISEVGRNAAEKFTYNNPAKGMLGKVVGAISQINTALPQGKFVFSFMNTLANIINQMVDYTPYGLRRANNKSYSQTHMTATDAYAPDRFIEGSPEQMAQKARAYIGTSVVMGLAYMAYRGLLDEQEGKEPQFSIHGAGPRDPFLRQQMQETQNWQPNSIKIGGKWWRYVDVPILGSLMGALGTAFDAFRYKKDEQTTSELLGMATMSGITTVLDKNLLQGANNFFQVIRGDSPGQQLSSLKRLGSGVVSGYTNPGMLRWARSTFTPDKDGMVNQLDTTSTTGWLMSMVPASIGYNTPALNTLGEPIKNPWYLATTRRFTNLSAKEPHPIFTPLLKAGLSVLSPSKATSFSVIQPDGSVLQTRMGRHPEVYRRYVELRGGLLREMLTPEVIAAYTEAAESNVTEAQAMLNRDVADQARQQAITQIEEEILSGKLKL